MPAAASAQSLVSDALAPPFARQEELRAFQEVVSAATQVARNQCWKAAFLVGYGVRFGRNIARCPRPGASCRGSRT